MKIEIIQLLREYYRVEEPFQGYYFYDFLFLWYILL